MLPPVYALDHGDIVADAGDETRRVHVDCAAPESIVAKGNDLFVVCGDETLTYTTVSDVMRPVLVDRQQRVRREAPEVDVRGTLAPSVPTRRERQTALGGVVIVLSLVSAAVLEGAAWGVRLERDLCFFQTSCPPRTDVPLALDVAAIIVAIGGTIAGIAVASTWHDVPVTSAWMPRVELAPGGGMIGVRVVF